MSCWNDSGFLFLHDFDSMRQIRCCSCVLLRAVDRGFKFRYCTPIMSIVPLVHNPVAFIPAVILYCDGRVSMFIPTVTVLETPCFVGMTQVSRFFMCGSDRYCTVLYFMVVFRAIGCLRADSFVR